MTVVNSLILLLSSWGCIAVIHAEGESSFVPTDIYDDNLDSSLFNPEPLFGEESSADQTIDSYSNLLTDGDLESPLFIEPDPGSSLDETSLIPIDDLNPSFLSVDGDIACDSSNAEYPQLFGKVRRRGDSCRTSPTGQTGGGSTPSDNEEIPSDLGFGKFSTDLLLRKSFPEDFQICPMRRFHSSNIPVCKVPLPEDVFSVLGKPWVNLRRVTACELMIQFWPGLGQYLLTYPKTSK